MDKVLKLAFQEGTVQVPTIHLNGSDAASLVESYMLAYEALGAALEALAKANPNQRDYYVQQPNPEQAWTEARDQQMARLQAVDGIRNELATIIMGIDTQEAR